MARRITISDEGDFVFIKGLEWGFPDTIPCTRSEVLRLHRAIGDALGIQQHGDPCDDQACPCRKAEADDWRDQGLARP